MHFRSQSKRRIFAAMFAVALSACGSDDDSETTASLCGNKKIDAKEVCDGSVPQGQTCASATMGARPGGVLACSVGCTFDTTKCTGSGGTGGGGGLGGSSGSSGSSGFGGTGGGTTGAGGGP
jgi:hypothetical protein